MFVFHNLLRNGFIVAKLTLVLGIFSYSLRQELKCFYQSGSDQYFKVKLTLNTTMSVIMTLFLIISTIKSLQDKHSVDYSTGWPQILIFHVTGRIVFDVTSQDDWARTLQTQLIIYVGEFTLCVLFMDMFKFLLSIRKSINSINEETKQLSVLVKEQQFNHFKLQNVDNLIHKHNECLEMIESFNSVYGVQIILTISTVCGHLVQSVHTVYNENEVHNEHHLRIICAKIWLCVSYTVSHT